jgi:prevent-host-death family protein
MSSTKSGSDPVSIRQLGKRATDVIRTVEEDGEAVLITRHAKPVAYIVSLEDAARLGLEPAEGSPPGD